MARLGRPGEFLALDGYASGGKPPLRLDDPEAKEALVDALVKDALAALA